ncbi:MAG: divalent-cation tolerance protein CutA [Gammaproteobacteria bacterium]
MNEEILVVLCTCPDERTGTGIATALLAENLAACVNCVTGIRSMYRWEGQTREDTEVLLVIKTTTSRYAALQALIQARHPYDVPEVIAMPVVAGASNYLDWIRQATSE